MVNYIFAKYHFTENSPNFISSLFWMWWWRTVDKEDGGGEEGEGKSAHDQAWRPPAFNWAAATNPAFLLNRQTTVLSASQAQSFLLQFSSKPSKEGEGGATPLGLAYNPILCFSPVASLPQLQIKTKGLRTCSFEKRCFGLHCLKHWSW